MYHWNNLAITIDLLFWQEFNKTFQCSQKKIFKNGIQWWPYRFHPYERRKDLQKLVLYLLCKAQSWRGSLPISPDTMPLNYLCNNFPPLFSNILFWNGAGISVDVTSQCPGKDVCVLNEPCQEACNLSFTAWEVPKNGGCLHDDAKKWPKNQKKEPTTSWEKARKKFVVLSKLRRRVNGTFQGCQSAENYRMLLSGED